MFQIKCNIGNIYIGINTELCEAERTAVLYASNRLLISQRILNQLLNQRMI